MLYECNRCGNLIDENKGIIIHKPFYLFLGSIISQIFICKDCLSKKGREKFDKAKKNSRTTGQRSLTLRRLAIDQWNEAGFNKYTSDP